jgi:methionyl-tRNA formyltransferase
MKIRLRAATKADERALFDWANDAITRANAFESDPIDWETHVEWLDARLARSETTQILIAERFDGHTVGQIRFDRSGEKAMIDYSVAPSHRGEGLGVRILEKGCRRALAIWPGVDRLVGIVKRENIGSVKSFERAGFCEDDASTPEASFMWQRENRRFVVAASRPWYRGIDERLSAHIKGVFELISAPDALSPALAGLPRPQFVFFPHWSWIIPDAVHQEFDCVVFHMTDLPFGRGGSPLQNLIKRGMTETKVSAIFVESGLDTGDVLLQRPMSLHGSAEEIYIRAAGIIEEMIIDIVESDPEARPQEGEPVAFKRRTPEESEISGNETLEGLFDHIRMLDAEGYPHAFIDLGPFVLRFGRASIRHGKLVTDCTITMREET